MSVTVDILVNDQIWLENHKDIEHRLKDIIDKIIPFTILNKINLEESEVELSIVLTASDEIKSLNKEYRKKIIQLMFYLFLLYLQMNLQIVILLIMNLWR